MSLAKALYTEQPGWNQQQTHQVHDENIIHLTDESAPPSWPQQQAPPEEDERDRINPLNNMKAADKFPYILKIIPPAIISLLSWLEIACAWQTLVYSPLVAMADTSLERRSYFCLVITMGIVVKQIAIWRAHFTTPAYVPEATELLFSGHVLSHLMESDPQEIIPKSITQCKRCSRWRPPSTHHCR